MVLCKAGERTWESNCFLGRFSTSFPPFSLTFTMLTVLGATNSQVFEEFSSTNSLEKEMATHPSILAWEIPCTEEPGGL